MSKGERGEDMRAVRGQGLVILSVLWLSEGERTFEHLKSWVSLNEVRAMEVPGRGRICPDSGVYRLLCLHWEEHSGG